MRASSANSGPVIQRIYDTAPEPAYYSYRPIHPLLLHALNSRLARAVEASIAAGIAIGFISYAFNWTPGDYVKDVAVGCAAAFGLVVLTNVVNLLGHVANTTLLHLISLSDKVHEHKINRAAYSTALVPISVQNISKEGNEVSAVKTVVDLVNFNRPKDSKVIPVLDVEVDTRDLRDFLWEAWDKDGGGKRGLKRDDWLGDGKTKQPYVFPSSGNPMTREYYDAIIYLLSDKLKLIRGRARGWSGELTMPPDAILSRFQWV